MAAAPPKKPFPIVAVVVPIVAIVAIALVIGVWQFLTPAERAVPVAYSDFFTEVRAGRVDEIRIKDREIRYRVRSEAGRPSPIRVTTGPVPDQHFYDSLRPDDPSLPRPKVFFEK